MIEYAVVSIAQLASFLFSHLFFSFARTQDRQDGHQLSYSPYLGLAALLFFHHDDMRRRRRPARDAPVHILRACQLALRSRAARVLPLVPPVCAAARM